LHGQRSLKEKGGTAIAKGFCTYKQVEVVQNINERYLRGPLLIMRGVFKTQAEISLRVGTCIKNPYEKITPCV
jgi:hypothetical protein